MEAQRRGIFTVENRKKKLVNNSNSGKISILEIKGREIEAIWGWYRRKEKYLERERRKERSQYFRRGGKYFGSERKT